MTVRIVAGALILLTVVLIRRERAFWRERRQEARQREAADFALWEADYERSRP